MCGLVGLINYKSGASIADEMVQMQYHRGPDANAAYVFGPETYDVWLGHNKFRFMDSQKNYLEYLKACSPLLYSIHLKTKFISRWMQSGKNHFTISTKESSLLSLLHRQL